MVKVELISKKVPRSLDDRLKRLQARYQLRHRKHISEAKIIETAVEHLEKHEEALEGHKMAKKEYDISDWFGLVKGGPKTNAEEELDDVVYADVDKT